MLHKKTIATAIFGLLSFSVEAKTAEEVYAEASPSIVEVFAKTSSGTLQGSGVVIARARVITNCHVISKASNIFVKWRSKVMPAYLFVSNEERDLCEITARDLSAQAVQFSKAGVRVGQKVYAIGNPRGLDLTLSDGLISSVRTLAPGNNMLQITAPITFGSSGGGLFNENAELVGITSSGIGSGNLNFALPVEQITHLIDEGKLFGKAPGSEFESVLPSVSLAISRSLEGRAPSKPNFENIEQRTNYLLWVNEMVRRLEKWMPDQTVESRREFVETVFYESKRAGIEPAMVLGLIQISSSFRRFYVSKSGALGYMAIDPSLARKAGDGDSSKLFDTQIGLRYGCSILRLFIDEEGGNLFLALGRWAGQRGKPEFPNRVLEGWKQWNS